MLNSIIWIILIIIIIASAYQWFGWLFKDYERDYKAKFKKLEDITWRIVKLLKDYPHYGNTEQAIKYNNERLSNFEKAHFDYLHLKERFRHEKILKQIKQDWKSYLKAINDIIIQEEISNEIGEKDQGKIEEAEIIIDEVEKKFKNYLKD